MKKKNKKDSWWFRLLKVLFFSLYIGLIVNFIYDGSEEYKKYESQAQYRKMHENDPKTDFSKYGLNLEQYRAVPIEAPAYEKIKEVSPTRIFLSCVYKLFILSISMYLSAHVFLYVVFGEKFKKPDILKQFNK